MAEVIIGLSALISNLQEDRKKIRQEVAAELYRFAEEVMADSKASYVPVLTGALMNSGKVMPPDWDVVANTVTVVMGYGDEAVTYALYVHENLVGWKSGLPINYTRPGSGPKYLERPLVAKQDELPARLTKAVMRAFGK